MANQGSDRLEVIVDNIPFDDDLKQHVALVRVEESVRLPGHLDLHLFDRGFDIFERGVAKIGSKIEASLGRGDQLLSVFQGEVTAIAVNQGLGTTREVVITAFDKLHRLQKEQKSRTFSGLSDDAIVKRVASDHSLNTDTESTGEMHELVIQHGQSDYDFIHELAARNGYDVWFSDDTLRFKPRPSSSSSADPLVWNENLLKFSLRASSANQSDSVNIRAWHRSGKKPIESNMTRSSYDFEYTDAEVGRRTEADASRAFGMTEVSIGTIPVDAPAEADSIARSVLRRSIGSRLVMRGEALGDARIAAGTEVTIRDVGESLEGKYLLTSVEHVYGSDVPYTTRFTSGGIEEGTLAGLLRGSANAGAAGIGSVGSHTWGGLAVGIVTNVDDPERLGRVKVKIPSLSDNDETGWARVVAPGAGADRGLILIPEIEDEVLVGYEFNDLRRPFVLGNLWNANDSPPSPEIRSGKVTARIWKSREGHKVEMIDDGESSRISVVLADGSATINVDYEGIQIRTERAIEISGKEIGLKSSGNINLEASGEVQIKATSVKVEATGEVAVTGRPIKLN